MYQVCDRAVVNGKALYKVVLLVWETLLGKWGRYTTLGLVEMGWGIERKWW